MSESGLRKYIRTQINEELQREELTLPQKKKVDTWPKAPENHAFSNDFFGGNYPESHTKVVPFEKKVPNSISNHLKQKGFDPSKIDQSKGTIKDKYNRDTRIGKVISDPNLKQTWANHQTSGKDDLNIHFSRHPHDVAGMTSCGQPWEEQSCMNFETGSNKRFLPKEVEHGTMLATLKDKEGKEKARIAIKPHTNSKGQTIPVPEKRVYGDAGPEFMNQVEQHLQKHFYDKADGGVYKKHPSVYNDSSNVNFYNIANIDKALGDEDPNVRGAAIHHPNATPEHISRALGDEDRYVRWYAISHPSATPEHISRALGDKDASVRWTAISHPSATPEHISRALGDKDASVRGAAISHPSATPEHISRALGDKDALVRRTAIRHPSATPEHISRALEDEDALVRRSARDAREIAKHSKSKIAPVKPKTTPVKPKTTPIKPKTTPIKPKTTPIKPKTTGESIERVKMKISTKKDLSRMIREELLREVYPDRKHLREAWEDVNEALLEFAKAWQIADNEEYSKIRPEMENLIRKIDRLILTRKV
jgi:HEAT repeat protein